MGWAYWRTRDMWTRASLVSPSKSPPTSRCMNESSQDSRYWTINFLLDIRRFCGCLLCIIWGQQKTVTTGKKQIFFSWWLAHSTILKSVTTDPWHCCCWHPLAGMCGKIIRVRINSIASGFMTGRGTVSLLPCEGLYFVSMSEGTNVIPNVYYNCGIRKKASRPNIPFAPLMPFLPLTYQASWVKWT